MRATGALRALASTGVLFLVLAGCTAVPGFYPVTAGSSPTVGHSGGSGSPTSQAPVASPLPESSQQQEAQLPLSGLTIVINPGHNGANGAHPEIIGQQVEAGGFLKNCDSTGTRTAAGYTESAFNFDLAQRVAARLTAAGATVVLTRSDDAGVGPCLDERAAIANAAAPALVLHLHADAGPTDTRGFHVIHPALAPNGANAAILEPSARLAVALREAFQAGTGEPFAPWIDGGDGLHARSDLAGLNLSTAPVALVECGNMLEPTDAALLSDPAWRDLAADSLVAGVTDFLDG